MALVASGILLLLFIANVAAGSLSGQPPLGNVGEMLLLLAASTLFVVAILRREADARTDEADNRPDHHLGET